MITYVGWSPHRSHRLFVACVHRLTISWCCCWIFHWCCFLLWCGIRRCFLWCVVLSAAFGYFHLLCPDVLICCVWVSSSSVFRCLRLLCSGVVICCVWVSPSAVSGCLDLLCSGCLHLLCSGVCICCVLVSPSAVFRCLHLLCSGCLHLLLSSTRQFSFGYIHAGCCERLNEKNNTTRKQMCHDIVKACDFQMSLVLIFSQSFQSGA